MIDLLKKIFDLIAFIFTSRKEDNVKKEVKRKELVDDAKKAVFSGSISDIDRVWSKLRK